MPCSRCLLLTGHRQQHFSIFKPDNKQQRKQTATTTTTMTTTPSSTTTSKDDSGANTNTNNIASTDAPVSTSASLVGSFRRAREYFAPVRAKSAFLSKGVLTPDEFIQAGDELVHRCPTWCWESGDPTKHKSFLPPDKQFLITRGVPSTARVDSIEQALTLTALHDDDDGDGEDDWLVSSIAPPQEKSQKKSSDDDDDELEDIEDDFDILDINEDGEVVETKKQDKKEEKAAAAPAPAPSATVSSATSPPAEDYPEDEEYADMADFEDDNILVDDAAADVAGGTTDVASASAGGTSTTTMIAGAVAGVGKTVPTRRYDISITYDKYYQTPRVWMTGFNEHQQPLSVEELMEDVVSDYRHKTVTMEPHPHSSGRQASIHPCQHAKVMKVIVQNLIKASGSKNSSSGDDDDDGSGEDTGPAVDVTQYLFIFLKFVSSIIPTVNYDFTMDVEASTSK